MNKNVVNGIVNKFNQGDRVIVKHSPQYGIATVASGNVCEITGQIAVNFDGAARFNYYYPENLVKESRYERDFVMNIDIIEKQFAAEVKRATGATVEVVIGDCMKIYTEDLHALDAIKALVGQIKKLQNELHYDADEDVPAGVTLEYSL